MVESEHRSTQVSVIFKNRLDTEESTDIMRLDTTMTMATICSLLNTLLSKDTRYLLYLNQERINTDSQRGLDNVIALQQLTTERVLEILYLDENDIIPENTVSCSDTVIGLLAVQNGERTEERVIYLTYKGEVYEYGKDSPINERDARVLGIFGNRIAYMFTDSTVVDDQGQTVFETKERIRCCAASNEWMAVVCMSCMYLINTNTGVSTSVQLKKTPEEDIRSIETDGNRIVWIENYDTVHIYSIVDGSHTEYRTGLTLTTLKISGDFVIALTSLGKFLKLKISTGEISSYDISFRYMNVLRIHEETAICGSLNYVVYENYSDSVNETRIIPIRGQVNDLVVAGETLYVAHDNSISTMPI